MTDKKKLNGSVDALSIAMREVFIEAMEVGIQPVKDAVDGLRTDMVDMEGRLNQRIDTTDRSIKTTNENMSAQFAEQEKKFGKLFKESSATA